MRILRFAVLTALAATLCGCACCFPGSGGLNYRPSTVYYADTEQFGNMRHGHSAADEPSPHTLVLLSFGR